MKSFLNDALDEYDLLIADTSPVLRVTDTVIFASQGIGAVIYVAHSNRTPKPLIRYSLDLLSDANVAGLILNSINMHQISSLYYAYQYPNYAYYSNAYAYGYDYYYGDDNSARRQGRPSLFPNRHKISSWIRRNLFPSE
jgi:Mrp family chromosome partitioning ATPase